MSLPDPVQKLIKLWSKLPGVGEKSARRMVFYVLSQDPEWARDFSSAVAKLADEIHHCSVCGNITDSDPCSICCDPLRNRKMICVVESDEDCVAIEQSGIYNGLYHVLGGQLSPLADKEIPAESIERLRARVTELTLQELRTLND